MRSTLCTRPARCAGDLAMADLVYHRPRSTMQVPRNYHPPRHRCCDRGCLLAPPTVKTPPAGTFPLVSANVSSRMVVSNYYEHFSSSPPAPARFGHGSMGVDAERLELSWNNSKPTPYLLVRPTYQATSHYTAAAACALNARAPLGVTHHTNVRARETSATAPPCPLSAHSTLYARDGASTAALLARDARAMCDQGGLAFIPGQIRDRDRGTARSKKGARYRTWNYEHEAAWWAMRDTRVRRPLEISNKPI